jgi:hypothetical protein
MLKKSSLVPIQKSLSSAMFVAIGVLPAEPFEL